MEQVSPYKYLGLFSSYIQQLVKKMRLKLGFFFQIISCLSLSVRKRRVDATFTSVLDYGDVLLLLNVFIHWIQFITELSNL